MSLQNYNASGSPQGVVIEGATGLNGEPTALSGPSAAALDATNAQKPPILTFLGHQLDVAVTTSAGLTVPAGTRYAIIQAKGAAVKYRYDGATTPPTATVGMSLANGQELAVDVGQTAINAMRFIQAAPTATLDVAYFS